MLPMFVFFLILAAKGSSGLDCPENEFNCGNGNCVADRWRCDGDNDCGNFKDEQDCENGTHCRGFKCKDNHCIPSAWKCDGQQHCVDGSDEEFCSKAPQRCPDDDFECSNGRCILSSSKCDRTDDCGDNSDEIGCPCESFTCPTSAECIPWSEVCDGAPHCRDLGDEGQLCASSCGIGSCEHRCQKTPRGSRCSCHQGYVLSDDGVSCVGECDTPGRCSHFCNYTIDGVLCTCAKGYALQSDRSTCKVVGREVHLAYVSEDGIRDFNVEMNSLGFYVDRNFSSVADMVYDASEGRFFWADRKEKTISSFSTVSERFEVLLSTRQEPVFLRRDWITKNLYYTTVEGSVLCCSGNYCTSVVTNVSSHISGFDISPAFGFLFWSVSRHPGTGWIERSNLDGSLRRVVVSDRIFLPTAIAVDPVLQAIYWCDSMLAVIESTDFNGLQRRKIFGPLQYTISMTVFEDNIYWTDTTNSVNRCEKFNGKNHRTILTKATPMKSLLFVNEAVQMRGENPCGKSNCPHICLPNGTSFVCGCDDRGLTDAPRCQTEQSCPEDYCPENFVCVVEGDRFFCKCPPHFTGERCENRLLHTGNASHPLWIVCTVLVVVCLCLFVALFLLYRRLKKSPGLSFGSKVLYANTASPQGCCQTPENVERHENEYEAVLVTGSK